MIQQQCVRRWKHGTKKQHNSYLKTVVPLLGIKVNGLTR